MAYRQQSAVLEELLRGRHSCRGFLPDELPESTIIRLFDLAQNTPSWCNAQPWSVHLFSGPAARRFADDLSRHSLSGDPSPDIPYPDRYDGVYGDRRRETAATMYNAMGIERTDLPARSAQMAENFRFFGAPHVAVISSPRSMGMYGAIDCGAYMSSLLLAAESLQIAALPQAAPAVYSSYIRDYLRLGRDRLIVGTVSFGLEDAGHPGNAFRTTRATVDDVVTRM